MKQPNLRTLAVYALSRVLLGAAGLVGLVIVAGTLGLALRLFIIAAGL